MRCHSFSTAQRSVLSMRTGPTIKPTLSRAVETDRCAGSTVANPAAVSYGSLLLFLSFPRSLRLTPPLSVSPTMAPLRLHSPPWISLPRRCTAASPSSSSPTAVVARMRQTQQRTDKSMNLTKPSKKEHHLWKKRDPTQSYRKASNLVRLVTQLPNEKEAIYGALDKWVAFDTEFPVIAVAKALQILRKSNHWLRIIQVCKWLFSKGQVLTWSTYDILLVALSMKDRIEEAEEVYNKIIKEYTRSTPRQLYARMISIYDYHCLPHKILEVFADMEEFGVSPDGDTTWRIGRAFVKTGQPEKVKLLDKYLTKWKYLYFDGKRVRVRRGGASDPFTNQHKTE